MPAGCLFHDKHSFQTCPPSVRSPSFSASSDGETTKACCVDPAARVLRPDLNRTFVGYIGPVAQSADEARAFLFVLDLPCAPSLSPPTGQRRYPAWKRGGGGGREKVSVSKQNQQRKGKIETGRISRGGVGLDPAAGPFHPSLPPPCPGRRPSLPRRGNPGLSVVGGNGRRVDGGRGGTSCF